MKHTLSIIVHGGAKPISPDKAEPMRAGCRAAADAGWSVLEAGGSALDAVETAIRVLEADPAFNAGLGSTLNPDGVVRNDAGLMEGGTLRAGAVAALEGVRHPITAARQVLASEAILVVGPHARQFAAEKGVELCDPAELIAREQREEWEEKHAEGKRSGPSEDTVGCVALDAEGNFAAGASTGGLGSAMPGRVGDSAQVGAGFYADNHHGATAMSGDGEDFMRLALAKTAVDLLREVPDAEAVARQAIAILGDRTGGKGGCILLDREGRPGWAHNEENFAVAYRLPGMAEPAVFLHKKEEAGALTTPQNLATHG